MNFTAKLKFHFQLIALQKINWIQLINSNFTVSEMKMNPVKKNRNPVARLKSLVIFKCLIFVTINKDPSSRAKVQ